MATTRAEKQLGYATGLSTTYTNLYTVPASTTTNLNMNICNRAGSDANLRIYVADTSWSTGEPTAGTLIAAVCLNLVVPAGSVIQLSGIVMATTQELIAYASATVDIIVSGVEITTS